MTTPNELEKTAKVVDWNDQKGFGYLQLGKQRVFLHRNEFAERHKKPAVGDTIRFRLGQDSKGRPCATHACHINDGGRLTLLTWGVVAGLLILPIYALYRQEVPAQWVALYVLLMGAITYYRYASDKRRARANEWRVSEAELHLLEVLGGWPGAFLEQRRLRHKCSKGAYQFVFWMVVLLYQFVAYDSLQDWRFSRTAWTRIESLSEQPR